jgi:hypothetical protein
MFLIALGCTFKVCGIYIRGFAARRRSHYWLLLGMPLVILGWMITVSHDDILSSAESASASHGSYSVSAPCYGRSEDIGVVPVVIPPFELRDVEREILTTNLVIAAHDAALDQRPEAVNRRRVDRTSNILAFGMVDRSVVEIFVQRIVSGVFVGRNEADFLGDGLANEAVERRGIGARNNAGNDVAFALDDASDGFLNLGSRARDRSRSPRRRP